MGTRGRGDGHCALSSLYYYLHWTKGFRQIYFDYALTGQCNKYPLFQAAIRGEHWEPILPRKETYKPTNAGSINKPPQNPPPRPPPEMRRKRVEDLEGAAYDNAIDVTANE